ncbi:MAG: IS21 family transposase [Kiritimatiellaeota bacterium]|nr:IS21 family transposase [Kiritimatiellota bacterium]
MANQIKMATSDSIITLYERGWSRRKIARELGLHRETVARHILLRAAGDSKPSISPAGILEGSGAEPTVPPAGSTESKPAILPAGKSGRLSHCAAYHAALIQGLETGLTAQRIYQDLKADHGFTGGYDSVKRYVRRLSAGHPKRVERMECAPGEEAQVDFGLGAPVVDEQGRRRRAWVFRVVLSHSRKGYSEAVYRQSTEEFIRCLENAFRHFGGVPRTLIIDNLRAAVSRSDWYEPELTPKVAAFCRHYGTVILPTRPRHPQHKGKVERGVGYVKGNALKGRTFAALAAENAYLQHWEEHIADLRIHGTTREQVGRAFLTRERVALLALPAMLFPCFEEGQRAVHRDSHVEVQHAYYEVPAEHIGRMVWVRWDRRLVRIFNQRQEQIAVHARVEAGKFSAKPAGRPPWQVARSADYWCNRARAIGPHCRQWAEQVRSERGMEAIRVLIGLQQLARRSGALAVEEVCGRALAIGAGRLRDLRRLLEHRPAAEQLTLLTHHPLIRDLQEYGRLVGPPPELPTAAPAGQVGPFSAAMDNSLSAES